MPRLNMWFIFHREHTSPLTAKQNNSWGQHNTAVLHVVWKCCYWCRVTGVSSKIYVGSKVFVFYVPGLAGTTRAPFLWSWRLFLLIWLGEGFFFWNGDSAGEEGKQPWWADLPTAGTCQHAEQRRLSVARRGNVTILVLLHQAALIFNSDHV